MNPAIVIVAPEHAAVLTDEFGRYVRDYDLHTTTTVAGAEDVARQVVSDGGQVAMFVAESQLPDGHVLEAFARWRAVVPTARRLVADPAGHEEGCVELALREAGTKRHRVLEEV